MPFLLTFPLSTTVFQPPPPVTTVFDFTSTVPAGVTVVRSGVATHITVAGFVTADPANLGRTDYDAVLDGFPPGSVFVALTSVVSIGLANTPVTASGRMLDAIPATGSAGIVLRSGFIQTNLIGTASSGAAGTPAIGSINLVGSTATGAVSFGSIAVAEIISLIGNAAASALGGVVIATTGASSLSGIAAAGAVSFLQSASVPPILSGLFGTGSAAFLPVSNAPSPLVGNTTSGTIGLIAPSAVPIRGATISGTPGIITIGISKALTSAVSTAFAGTVTIPGPSGGFSSGFSSGFNRTMTKAFSSAFSSGFG